MSSSNIFTWKDIDRIIGGMADGIEDFQYSDWDLWFLCKIAYRFYIWLTNEPEFFYRFYLSIDNILFRGKRNDYDVYSKEKESYYYKVAKNFNDSEVQDFYKGWFGSLLKMATGNPLDSIQQIINLYNSTNIDGINLNLEVSLP